MCRHCAMPPHFNHLATCSFWQPLVRNVVEVSRLPWPQRIKAPEWSPISVWKWEKCLVFQQAIWCERIGIIHFLNTSVCIALQVAITRHAVAQLPSVQHGTHPVTQSSLAAKHKAGSLLAGAKLFHIKFTTLIDASKGAQRSWLYHRD